MYYPNPTISNSQMWKFETEGRGRRAVVLSVSNGVESFTAGELVHCGAFIGGIVAFRQGETDRSHQVQMLQFVLREDEILATSLLRWHGFEELGKKLDKASFEIRRAIDHHRHHQDKIEELPSTLQLTTGADLIALSKEVSRLFLKPATPRKSSPKKHSITPSNSHLRLADQIRVGYRDEVAEVETLKLSGDFSTSEESGSDEELEMVPARKRRPTAKNVSTRLAKASLKSPRKRNGDPANKSNLNSRASNISDDVGLDAEESDDSESIRSVRKFARPKTTRTPQNSDGPKINLPRFPTISSPLSAIDRATANLHPASDPAAHKCRDSQFDQLFVALEGAIAAQTGTCIYVSGTPGTGKTSVIREVVAQLDLRVREKELSPFTFLEINGMKLVHPNDAYGHLWKALDRGQMSASNAMSALEAVFTTAEPQDKRGVMVLLLDELDQLMTSGQQLMYNFFNWPSLPHSRLIVLAVANIMDLPERMLSNKISSRVGLTRIQFPGYTHTELKEIVTQRLGDDCGQLIVDEAIEYATRKVAGVGGDARRVLDFIRQAIILAANSGETANEGRGDLPAKTSHVRDVILSSQTPPSAVFIKTLGSSTKVLLCALLARIRRTNSIEAPIHEVLKQASQLVKSAVDSENLVFHLYAGRTARLAFFQTATMELVESGIIMQQAIKGEASPIVRLMVPVESIKDYLENDTELKGMI